MDANEDGSTAKSKLNIHNNEVIIRVKIIKPLQMFLQVGRRMLKKSMRKLCKCHGVSGSCSMKVRKWILKVIYFRILTDLLEEVAII